MKRVFHFFAIFLISLPFNSCEFFSDSVEKDFSEAAKKYSENYREAVFNEDKTEFFELVKNVETNVRQIEATVAFKETCAEKQPFKELFRRIDTQIQILLDSNTSDARRKQIAWDLNSDLENSSYFRDFYLLKQREQPPGLPQILILIGFFLAIVAIITTAIFGFYKIRLLKQKKINQKILEIQEEERIRISNELHDTIAQNLKSIQMESENQNNQPVSKMASDSINQIRALCYNLMPPDFSIDSAESKLENLLDFLCKDLTSKGFACHFFSDGNIPQIKDKNVLLNIFRIVQEALNNAQIHSKATNCSVLVKNKDSSIIIFVTDNGIGIPEEVLKNGKQNHYGIHSMRSRAEIIGAELDIKSEENDGTEIRLEIKI